MCRFPIRILTLPLPLVAGLALSAGLVAAQSPVTVLVEAEGFTVPGGWKADTQSVEQMGSVYAIAHGMGKPVADATTTVSFPATGSYRVWVRSRNWVPGNWTAPGRFRLSVGETTLATEFGTGDGTWQWQDGGVVAIGSTDVSLALKDLTGFDGRCDAIAFIQGSDTPPPDDFQALKNWRRAMKNEASAPGDTQRFDVVIAGGGMAGCCASLAAARSGITVALIHDRPVLGGNASQEVRVGTRGQIRHPIVDEIDTLALGNRDNGTIAADTNRLNKITTEPNITLFMPWRAEDAGTDAATRRITHVDARHVTSGARVRLQAGLFIDCTGDGWIGHWAGADYRMGWEASSEFNESLGKPTFTAMTLGNSLMWKTRIGTVDSTFPAVPWAMDVAGSAANTGGDWNWEYGMQKNTITDAEHIRDHLLRAIYGNFSNAKKAKDANGVLINSKLELDWVPYIAGKRESRRLMGDYIVTQNDMVNGTYFEDAVGTTDWGIDLHYETGTSYISRYEKTSIAKPSYFPYRSLYSRNIPNLFMAGRNFSCTHAGLGSPRVMNTTGQMGVAVGYAAAICKQYGISPRDVYRIAERTTELQARITGTWPARPSSATTTSVVIDNADTAGVSIRGPWTPSTGIIGYNGDNYLYADKSASGTKRVAFTPSNLAPGSYTVAARWTTDPGRATNAPIWVMTTPPPPNNVTALHLLSLRGGQADTPQTPGETITGRYAPSDYARGLLRFNLSAIPAHAIVHSVELETHAAGPDTASLTGPAGVEGLQLYRVNEPCTPGEATWNKRDATTPWGAPGGGFDAIPLAGIPTPTDPSLVKSGDTFLFSSAALATALDGARSAGTPLDLLLRTPSLETTYNARKLYRFSSAILKVAWFTPSLPATYTANQRTNNGQWVTLGTHDVSTSGITVIVGNDGVDGYVVADAVRFSPAIGESDRDNDSLPDWWERWHFLSETAASPANDSDHDGHSDRLEFLTGCDPRDAASRFDAKLAIDKSATCTLRWPSAEGRTYRVEASSDCQNWQTIEEHVAATPPENLATYGFDNERAFLRVVLE